MFVKKQQYMYYPILMADIIDSSQKEPQVLMNHFKTVVAAINDTYKPNLVSPLTITLGDEFQGIIDSTKNGVDIILAIEETILKYQYDIKLRYVLVWGKIDTSINTLVAYEMLGPGLTMARNILNNLKNEHSRFAFILEPDEKEVLLNKIFIIYQSFVDSWKLKDSRLISEFLKYKDYKIIAENENIDRSTAWRRKKSLNITEYETVKDIITLLIK